MNDFNFDEYLKPKKIRKQKTHRQPVRFDDDFEEIHPRKQAGKRKHSRHINTTMEYGLDDEDELEQYKHLLK